jgi:hypothetical protein
MTGAVPGPQQVADRHQIQRIGLEPSPSRELPLAGHLGRVDLDELPFLRQDTRADQRLVIMPGGLHPDPDQPDHPSTGGCLDSLDQQPHPSHGHRELERTGQQLPGEVAHQRHRGMLADIDRDRDQLRRVDATGRLGQLLGLGAMDMHHEPTTSVRCEGELALPLCTSGGGPRSPPFYISRRRRRGSRHVWLESGRPRGGSQAGIPGWRAINTVARISSTAPTLMST